MNKLMAAGAIAVMLAAATPALAWGGAYAGRGGAYAWSGWGAPMRMGGSSANAAASSFSYSSNSNINTNNLVNQQQQSQGQGQGFTFTMPQQPPETCYYVCN